MGYTIPDGVDTMLDVVGVGWPNVDEDAYRDMADALREFAEDADDDAYTAHQDIQRLLSSGQSESLTALDRHWKKVQGKNTDLAKAARIIAGALDRVADIIVARKIAAVAELADLCATVGIALAAAPFTMGLTSLLAAGKIAATRIAFKRILQEMAESAVAEITATLTAPAVAALESIVTDLAIQTAMNVAAGQDGPPADPAGPGGGQGLQLNSAGPGPGSGPVIDHDAHAGTGTKLAAVQVSMQTRAAGKIGKAKGHHGRAKGRDSLTAALDTTIEGVVEKLVKGHGDLGDHLGRRLPDAIKGSSRTHKNTDGDVRDGINSITGSGRKDDSGLNGHRGNTGPARDSRGSARRAEPASLDKATTDPQRHATPLGNRTCQGDPVDVATGEMVMPHTDLALPGILPLILRRVHVSEYRYGHWFGRSWASTLDERIELDTRGRNAIWAREDGSLLVYPRLPSPADSDGVLPLEGARLPLTHGGEHNAVTTYRITDPHTGLIRTFTGSPYNASPAHWLTGIEDRHGNGITLDRLGDGSPTRITHDGGYRVNVTMREARVRRIALHTPDGPVTVMRYGYDTEGNLETVTNSSGRPLRFTYDPDGRITSWTDRNNSAFHYTYDTAGRVAATAGPNGCLSSTFAYASHPDTGGSITRHTNSQGATTTLHINSRHQTVAETDPAGHTTRYAFDALDRRISATDPLGRTTRLERDESGNITAMTMPDGERTTAVYNNLHLPLEITERGGARYRYTYDTAGNQTAVTGPTGERTAYLHDSAGAVTEIRPPAGSPLRIRNNAAGLPQVITAANGGSATCTRDPFGRVTTVTDATGSTLRQEWTPEGKLSWRELPDGTREEWTWDGEGNLLQHTDRMGRTHTHTYSHFDRPAATHSSDGTGYTFTHDSELRLTRVTNATGAQWTYTYDHAGRLTEETDFGGRTLTYQHDAAGRLTRRRNGAGQVLDYERDVLGRVIRVTHGTSTVSSVAYSPTGAIREITSPDAHITRETDPAGRLLAETVNGHTSHYRYDAQGRRTWRQTPSGAESSLHYNAEGLASYRTGEHTFRFDRDALGRETSRTLNHAVTMRQTWDPVGRLTHHHVHHGDTEILERLFTYQPDGTPTSISDSTTGRRTFTLDTSSHITAVHAPGWNEQYTYNTAGDQTRAEHSAPSAPGQDTAGSRHYDGTLLTRSGRTTYTYDAQGRLTQRSTHTLSGKKLTWTFAWDAADHLILVHTPQGTTWRYRYDGLGRRIAKTHHHADGTITETTDYRWDGTQLAEQRTGNTVLVWDYLGLHPLAQREAKYRNGQPSPEQRETDRRFFAIVTDLTGSPHSMLAPDGTVSWRARTAAWGATQWNNDATAYTPLRYPGQIFDPETGLHYNLHRYYDPDNGRYISPDPLGLTPAPNHYTYVPNPFTTADPLGLAGCSPDRTWGGRVVFTQDKHGRPFEMHATITRDMLDEGTDANNRLKPPGFLDGNLYNQARGHMLARMLGGTGDHLDNLFTITQNPTNSPHMRDLEQSIYNAVAGNPGNPGQTVQYSVFLEYTDNDPDSVPSRIYMAADGARDFHLDTDFANPDHIAQQNRRRLGIQ
ncbi:RHS repeat-associated core domain-containing protein [Streptomyces sp. CAU 1734]|uniref:RHS repeat-associated core domain-containing protein n=1 Tax=Streptomyces sp. CAU 1734 TaxID=3140360 RepID=UPI0032617DE8